MLIDLNWNNFLQINEKIRVKKFIFDYFSPVQWILWSSYDISFKMRELDDCIIFYFRKNDKPYSLFQSFYTKDFNLKRAKQIIEQDLVLLNNNKDIKATGISNQMIIDWGLQDNQWEQDAFTSNFIYYLDQLKTYAGRKMQKKRNHLNAFLKANYNIHIKDIHEVSKKELLDFAISVKEAEEAEINSYHQLLDVYHSNKNFSGIVIYINQKIVAFTLGFLNYDVYEILIEKARKDIRGLYQYLIKTNLELNNINCTYIDRTDDNANVLLNQSKLSYNPILAIKRNHCNKLKW